MVIINKAKMYKNTALIQPQIIRKLIVQEMSKFDKLIFCPKIAKDTHKNQEMRYAIKTKF